MALGSIQGGGMALGRAVLHLDAPSCLLVVVMVVVAEQGQIAYR
jgi:hypothetical protein